MARRVERQLWTIGAHLDGRGVVALGPLGCTSWHTIAGLENRLADPTAEQMSSSLTPTARQALTPNSSPRCRYLRSPGAGRPPAT